MARSASEIYLESVAILSSLSAINVGTPAGHIIEILAVRTFCTSSRRPETGRSRPARRRLAAPLAAATAAGGPVGTLSHTRPDALAGQADSRTLPSSRHLPEGMPARHWP